MAETQIKNVLWWHERFADWLLANPHLTQNDAAREFCCSVSWLSILKNSDAFREHFAKKSGALSAKIADTLLAKTAGVAEMALDAMAAKLENPALIPYPEILHTAEMTLKRLGYGADAKARPAPININFSMVTPEQLAMAREKMHQLRETNAQSGRPGTTPLLLEGRELEEPSS